MGRRACPVCGSKQWRKEASSGMLMCSEGHLLQGYRNETKEVTELGPHQMKKRTLKSGRKAKEKLSRADPNLYYGERGRFLYFQCLQLLLRLQVKVLMKRWDLPEEFEVVCRDLWALHLSLLSELPDPEPYLFRRGVEAGTGSHDASKSTRPGAETDPFSTSSDSDSTSSPTPSASSSSSSSDNENFEMERLMREASESPSDASGDEEDIYQPLANRMSEDEEFHAEKSKRRSRRYDSPASNIAILVLACWTLRIPIMYMDFIKLIQSYDLPYLEPTRYFPPTMMIHLTKNNIQALSPYHPPEVLQIHTVVSRFARRCYEDFRVYTPEMNALPLLWRAVRTFQGTPTLYTMCKELAGILMIPNTLHWSLASSLKIRRRNDPQWHKTDGVPVEVALACIVVVVLKMVYGLDGKERFPRWVNDPALSLPRAEEFIAAMKDSEKLDTSSKPLGGLEDASGSALELDDREIDEYIDFCERTLLHPGEQPADPVFFNEFFPLPPPSNPRLLAESTVEDDSLPRPWAAMSQSTSDRVLHPGERYTIYSASDVMGALPEDYETVIRKAARWTGAQETYISRAVESYERRFSRWWDAKLKEQKEKERLQRRGASKDQEVQVEQTIG